MADYSSYMWSVPDWRTDEMYTELDNREQGIYRNLIDECWVTGSISADMEVLARSAREPLEYFMKVWVKIQHKFRPTFQGARLMSKRLEQDRKRLEKIRNNYTQRARKGAEIKWKNHREKLKAEKELHASSINQALLADAQTQTKRGKEGEGEREKEGEKEGEKGSPFLQFSNPIDSPSRIVLPPEFPAAQNAEKSADENAPKNPPKPLPVKRTGKTRVPAELPITDAMRQWADDHGLGHVNLPRETEAMLDHFRGKGEMRSDWVATWRTWMRNSTKFGGGRNGTGPRESEAEARQRRTDAAADRAVQQVAEKISGAVSRRASADDNPGLPGIARRLSK